MDQCVPSTFYLFMHKEQKVKENTLCISSTTVYFLSWLNVLKKENILRV